MLGPRTRDAGGGGGGASRGGPEVTRRRRENRVPQSMGGGGAHTNGSPPTSWWVVGQAPGGNSRAGRRIEHPVLPVETWVRVRERRRPGPKLGKKSNLS